MERLVSLAPHLTVLLFALGLGDNVAGVTRYCDYPPEAELKEKVGGIVDVDMERLVSLAPHLVLLDKGLGGHMIPELEESGLPFLALDATSVEDMLQGFSLVGGLTRREKEAAEVVSGVRAAIEEVQARLKSLSLVRRPRVFLLIWPEPLQTVRSQKYLHEVIELAGGINVSYGIECEGLIELDKVVESDPEVIVATIRPGVAGDFPYEWARAEPRLDRVAARQSDRIFAIDSRLLCPGPRVVEGLKKLVTYFHGDILE